MARRSNTSKSTTEAPEATEGQEATVSTDTTTTESAPKADEKPAETPIDLTGFQKVAKEAADGADSSTGEVSKDAVESVVKEYRALEGVKAKNAAKAWLNEQMKEAMNNDSIQGARSYLQLGESMTAGSSGSSTPKAPADPTEAFVQRVATLELAEALLEPSEGVKDDWREKADTLVGESSESAQAYKAWLESDAEDKGDEPEATAVVKNAVKLALGRSAKAGGRASGGGGTFTGERRDIAKHIAEAFADKASGDFLTIAEIKNFSSQEYGSESPSAGAISARLFPTSGKNTVQGVTPGTNDKGNKGAFKA